MTWVDLVSVTEREKRGWGFSHGSLLGELEALGASLARNKKTRGRESREEEGEGAKR